MLTSNIDCRRHIGGISGEGDGQGLDRKRARVPGVELPGKGVVAYLARKRLVEGESELAALGLGGHARTNARENTRGNYPSGWHGARTPRAISSYSRKVPPDEDRQPRLSFLATAVALVSRSPVSSSVRLFDGGHYRRIKEGVRFS